MRDADDGAVARDGPWPGTTAYSIKRHGTTIATCDGEPVRTPGCVQAHGVLLVLRAADLTIAQASENTQDVLGVDVSELLGQPVSVVVGQDGQARIARCVASESVDGHPRHLFSTMGAEGRWLDVGLHASAGSVLLEFEPADLAVAAAGDDATCSAILARLQDADSLGALCTIAAQQVRRLTGFDRVMVYRFHEDGHGEVVAEDRRQDLPAWLGLHYPAEDIPQPARDVFERIWLRPTPDVGGALAELVPLTHPDTGAAVDMTHCVLRGASVMYTEYLQNMKVTAGATMAIRRGNRLWGLVACHHYTGPRFLGHALRATCELVAQVVSLQHQAAEERELARERLALDEMLQRLLVKASPDGDLSRLTSGTPNMLDAMGAGGGAIRHGGRWWRVGETPDESQLDDLAAWLATRAGFQEPVPGYVATDRLPVEHPPAGAYAGIAAGVLALPLSREAGSVVMWFRPETVRTIAWGGNPHDKPMVTGSHGPRLAPRASFERFVESVRGRSLPWRPIEREAAARFRVLLMEWVVGRAEHLARLNAELTRSNERHAKDEASLRESEKRLRLALRAGQMGVWTLNPTTDESAVDETLRQLSGLNAPAADGSWAKAFRQRIHPDDLPTLEADVARAMREGGDYHHEFRYRHPSGRTLWLAGYGMAVRDASGAVSHLTGVNFDITRRKQVDHATQQTGQRLQVAVAAARAGAWEWDVAAGTLDWSPEMYRLYGLDAGAVPQFAEWQRLLHADDAPRVAQAVADTFARRAADFRLEFRVHVSGGVRWLLAIGRAEYDAAGQPKRMIGINLDISEFKQMETALVVADQRKDEFLAMLAHELRNPLAPLRNGLALLRLGDLPAGAARHVAMMDRQLSHLVTLVDDLLDVSRISLGKIALHLERVRVADALDAAVETCRPLVEQRRHRLLIEVGDATATVEADRTRLAQIIGNLIGNAAKYTEPGGRIEVVVERDGPSVEIRVRDSGVGIAADDLPAIWSMFTQVGHTLDKAQGGLGIGLSLTRRLVELHGGSVTAHSDGPGRGSLFVVRLPLAADAPAPAAARIEMPPAQPLSTRRRVLIIDDNQDGALTLADLVQALGHDTAIAHDGPRGLERAGDFEPDLALVDIGLPGMDGYEVARTLRADPGRAAMRLVALTGWGSDADKRKALAAGFDLHLTKPVGLDELAALLPGVPGSLPLPRPGGSGTITG